MTTQHRKCGCDCNDQTRWVEDTGILQATFDCGCAGGMKPPCVYYANFECLIDSGQDQFPPPFDGLTLQYSRGVPTFAVELRPTCKWGPRGRYVSLKKSPTEFNSWEVLQNESAFTGNCTWDDVEGLGNTGVSGSRSLSDWNAIEDTIQWTLLIASTPVTMTHYLGATYLQKDSESWDCFGPNTLWLDKDPTEYSRYTTLPKFVCITPSVFAAKNKPTSCNQCYGLNLPAISTARGYIPSQQIQFLRAGIEHGSTGGQARAQIVDGDFLQAPFLYQWVYAASTTGSLVAKDQYIGGRDFAVLHFLDPIQSGQSSRATIIFPSDGSVTINSSNSVGYYCENFQCGSQNTFMISASVAGFPMTLTMFPEDCTRSNQYQWGPCWKSLGYTGWEAGYPSGESEESRKLCCDPWCSCAPGWLKVYNPSGGHLSQSFGGLTSNPSSSTAFCAGGRVGLNSPSNISREWCLPAVYSADDTLHKICMVLYCGSLGGGQTWLIDWYCDDAFVATRNMNQVMTCCPNQMSQTAPAMPCLPGAVLCVGINVEPTCTPPPPPCCNLSDYGSTLTLSMYTTGCSGWPATVSLTRSGSVFSGSFSIGGNAVLVTFDCVNPVNGVSCGLKLLCSATGANQTGQMTSVSCSPPTLTGTVNLGLTFGCNCSVFASVLCVLNTP